MQAENGFEIPSDIQLFIFLWTSRLFPFDYLPSYLASATYSSAMNRKM